MGGCTSPSSRSCSGITETRRACVGTCAFQKLGSDLELLVDDGTHSDFAIMLQGREYALHRCILSARSSFFRNYFLNASTDEAKEQMDLERVVNLEGVGCEAFISVIKFIYGAKERLLGSSVTCLDETCDHDACWPAVNFVLDYLRIVSVFELSELMADAEDHLLTLVDKVPVEYLLTILVIARTHEFEKLQSSSLATLAKAKWNYLSLEKLLPVELVEEIKRLKRERGHIMPTAEDEKIDKQARRVQRALDSDDVELVQLLLNEGNVNFDEVHGLHYAAAYCDEKTVREILDLQLSDPNLKNYRDLTVLHIACMRREPEILAGLLAKGARSREATPDGRTPSQIVKRLTKSGDTAEDESQRARLCLEILEQAETQFSYSPAFRDVVWMPITDEKELIQKLLYLENRVALAKVLFPREAQIVLSLAHVEATSEYTGADKSNPNSPHSQCGSPFLAGSPAYQSGSPTAYQSGSPTAYQSGSPTVYQSGSPTAYQSGSPTIFQSGSPTVYQAGSPTVFQSGSPASHNSGSPAPGHARRNVPLKQTAADNLQFEQTVSGLDASLLQRVTALRKAVELGHSFFPRCSGILDKYMDDDTNEFPIAMDKGSSEEHSSKRQRLNELKEILEEAFTKDFADMDQQKGFKKLPPSLSSSSSSSSRGGSPMKRQRSGVKDK